MVSTHMNVESNLLWLLRVNVALWSEQKSPARPVFSLLLGLNFHCSIETNRLFCALNFSATWKSGSDNIHLNKEIFGISAHLTAKAQSCVEMKISYCKNDKLRCLQAFDAAVNPTVLCHGFMLAFTNMCNFPTAVTLNTKVSHVSNRDKICFFHDARIELWRS